MCVCVCVCERERERERIRVRVSTRHGSGNARGRDPQSYLCEPELVGTVGVLKQVSSQLEKLER